MMRTFKLALAAVLAAFFVTSAGAQNAGSVTNHAFVLGKGPGTTGYTSLLCTSAQLVVGQSAADPICRTITGDVTITAAGVTAIGASKVTNSQLATMAANTTKCNATAGTANPTDCTASTMKTNLGLVIGTNVEAWDADLDCLAALSSTGVISRTGSGTCSAGALALSGLATGTQDTVIGYWGSATATAIAINNCTGALTYSTSTHTFGCNAAAGTGTVTSVTCGTGLSGGAFTTTGTCALNVPTFSNAIASDVPLSGTLAVGPSAAQGTTGTFYATAKITFRDTSAANTVSCRLWDSTTVMDSGAMSSAAAAFVGTISLSGYITNPVGNIRVSCKAVAASGAISMLANFTGDAQDSSVRVLRIN